MGVMSDHNFRAFGAAARAFRRSAATLGSGSSATGAISSVTTSPASAPAAFVPLLLRYPTINGFQRWSD